MPTININNIRFLIDRMFTIRVCLHMMQTANIVIVIANHPTYFIIDTLIAFFFKHGLDISYEKPLEIIGA